MYVFLYQEDNSAMDDSELLRMDNYGWADISRAVDDSETEEMQCDNHFGIHPFYIKKGSH